MRFKTLFAVCALFGSLFQSSPSLSETLRTAWLGEHEAFLTWYAKEKGWDKEAGLDIIMLRFDSGKSLIENVRAYDWAIAGCGAVPAMQATMSDQVEVIAIANDESSANMILTRPDSPILAEKGFNPDFPNVFGTPESVKGKLILCPKKTSARYLLDKWLAALGLEEKDVKIEELEPTPALGAFKNGYGDILAVWSPFTREAETLGFKVAAHSQDCGATQPVLLVADRAFTEKNPDAVRAFLKVYLRVADEIKAQGPETLAPAYVRFAEAWMGKKFSEADAIAELREHPVFSLEEQLALFGEDETAEGMAGRDCGLFREDESRHGASARHARSRLGPLPQGAQVILRRHGKKAFAAFPQRAFGCGDSVSPGFPAFLPGTV
ncbi:MAG: ABC transporter substrate-binding protein [Bilophila wadsworthia]